MTPDISHLISGYLDDVLTDDQQAELAAWIEADPANADQFAQSVFLDNRIHAEVNAAPFNAMDDVVHATTQRNWIHQRWPQIAATLAACVLAAVSVGIWRSQDKGQRLAIDVGDSPADSSFASIAQIIGADWDDAGELRIGDRLSAQTIQLRSGFLRLAFDDGVEVTLQGPAEYQLLAVGKTKLTSGLLTATVPPGAEGFTVDTPSAEVVDLGTAFGIDLLEDGVSRISVFEGEVEVALPDSIEKRLLREGDAVRVEGGKTFEAVDFDPESFKKIWPVSSGIERSTEAFRFVPPWPPQQRFVRSDADIFIAPEGHVATLLSSLRVNISSSGTYTREEDLTVSELAVGQRVRSFTLFYHPEKAGPRHSPKEVTGSITFDSPVLGLIVLHEELQLSARRFSREGPRNINESQQLELTGDDDSDVITISEDRRTITLTLTSPARFAELMRVVVDASKLKRSSSRLTKTINRQEFRYIQNSF